MPLPLLFQSARAKGFDPLALAIAEYQVATAAFNATPDYLTNVDELEDIAVAESYAPALDALRDWTEAASSGEVAASALTLGIKELLNGDTDLAEAMMRAALGYLQRHEPAAAAA